MVYKSEKETPKKKKFAGGLMFLGFFIVVACLIYLPWERYLPIQQPPQFPLPPAETPADPATPAAPQSVQAQLAYERYGRPEEAQPMAAAWYNDGQIFMKTITARRQQLAASSYTIVVLVGLVLPFSIFFFIK